MTFIPDHFSSQLLANENVLTIKQNEIILPPILLLLSIYLSTFGLVFTILFLFLLLPVAFYICHCYVYKGNKIHSHFYVSWAFSSFFILLYVFECIVVPFLEITIWENYTLLLFLTSGLLIIFYIRHQIKHNINLSEKVDSFQFYNLWISSYIYTKYLKLYLLTLLCLISALTFGAYLSITTVCQTHLVGTFLLVPDDCSEVYFDTNLSLSFVAALYSLMLVIMLSFSLFSRLLTFVGSRPSYHPVSN